MMGLEVGFPDGPGLRSVGRGGGEEVGGGLTSDGPAIVCVCAGNTRRQDAQSYARGCHRWGVGPLQGGFAHGRSITDVVLGVEAVPGVFIFDMALRYPNNVSLCLACRAAVFSRRCVSLRGASPATQFRLMLAGLDRISALGAFVRQLVRKSGQA